MKKVFLPYVPVRGPVQRRRLLKGLISGRYQTRVNNIISGRINSSSPQARRYDSRLHNSPEARRFVARMFGFRSLSPLTREEVAMIKEHLKHDVLFTDTYNRNFVFNRVARKEADDSLLPVFLNASDYRKRRKEQTTRDLTGYLTILSSF